MIDLRSDTVTHPSRAMRQAASEAEVGDDVYREDPSVNALEEEAASLLGTDHALYCPSGTMANQIAARTHTDRGEEVIVERESHVYKWERAGLAQHSNLQIRPVDGSPRGAITPDQIQATHVAADGHRTGTGLLCLENTHNSYGGTALAPEEIFDAATAARDLGIPVHLDGARLANAAVTNDVAVSRYTEGVDSVMLSLSKGLGAPVGSVLGGNDTFIERARRVRKLFGGGMRQAGVIAAPARLALENVDRLTTDHANAARLADGLDGIDGFDVSPPETNIVLIDVAGTGESANSWLERFTSVDVLGSELGEHTIRLCTHLDVTEDDIDDALDRIEDVRQRFRS